jgi:predicted AAA+ superfamily ATPase
VILERTLSAVLLERARGYPVLTVTGPRQSGKTTLCRQTFPDKPYVTLESLDEREEALHRPREFLARYPGGAILDEVQRAPQLLSYLQGVVDEQKSNGDWVLTGSQHFSLLESITQSLAGRTTVLHLLPLSLAELRPLGLPSDPWELVFAGGYPRIHEQRLQPAQWLEDYVATYVERDVREVLQVGNLVAFRTFMRLCASRSGQLLNLSSLGGDASISHHTARSWMTVLETSFLAWRLPPWFRSASKRLVKSPKLCFYDSGLLCRLLRIESVQRLTEHELRGSVFECWVLSELVKAFLHHGRSSDWSFFRDHDGRELDAVLDRPGRPLAVEIKSSKRAQRTGMDAFDAFAGRLGATDAAHLQRLLIHAGDTRESDSSATLLPWNQLDRFDWLGSGQG